MCSSARKGNPFSICFIHDTEVHLEIPNTLLPPRIFAMSLYATDSMNAPLPDHLSIL